MTKELELKAYKKSIGNQQQNKDSQLDTEDPPKIIFEGHDVSDGENLYSPEVIEIPK